MSISKAVKEPTSTEPTVNAAPVETEQGPARPVEDTALKIAPDPELGCDPYNRTGQFLLEAIKQYRD